MNIQLLTLLLLFYSVIGLMWGGFCAHSTYTYKGKGMLKAGLIGGFLWPISIFMNTSKLFV